jgi:hypothetical protein
MTVYLCYDCTYNYCDVFESVQKCFRHEGLARLWQEEITETETHWRRYEAVEVE